MSVDPGIILGILAGIFNAALYVVIRGSAGGRLLLIAGAAILGAWVGDVLGDRLGLPGFTIGDFQLVAATIGSWLGIAFVSVIVTLGPTRRRA